MLSKYFLKPTLLTYQLKPQFLMLYPTPFRCFAPRTPNNNQTKKEKSPYQNIGKGLGVVNKRQQAKIDLLDKRPHLLNKIHPELKLLKKQDMPFFDESLEGDISQMGDFYPSHSPDAYLKAMDGSFENFFFKRPFTKENFVFHLQVLARQGLTEHCVKSFHKMEVLGIQPNQYHYNQLMLAFAKKKDIEMVDQLMEEAKAKHNIEPSVILYNNILQCYALRQEPAKAHATIREMIDRGLQPDTVSYSTVINAYFKNRQLDKCWELYAKCKSHEFEGTGADEQLTAFMIRVCAASHDSEKAIRLFNELQLKGFVEHAKPYNAIIMACASTRRHAHAAIKFWQQMNHKSVACDERTYVSVLMACSKLGDIHTAFDLLQDFKLQNYKMNVPMYNGLIKTYAGACLVPKVKESHIDLYIEDSWKLFNSVRESNDLEVNVQLLDTMVQLYANALRPEELEAKVLPLYDKFKIPYTIYTYQKIMKMYMELRECTTVLKLYEKIKKQENLPNSIKLNQMTMNIVLETALREEHVPFIIDALYKFEEIGKLPDHRLHKKISHLQNMPDELYYLLKTKFQGHKYGPIINRERVFDKPHIGRRYDLPHTKPARRGRRLRIRKAGRAQHLSKRERKSLHIKY